MMSEIAPIRLLRRLGRGGYESRQTRQRLTVGWRSLSPDGNVLPVVLGVVAGGLLAVSPMLAFGLLGIVVAVMVVVNAAVRLSVVVFGALLVLQSSDGLSGPKVVYLGLYCIAAGAALLNMDRVPSEVENPVRPLLLVGPALLGCVALSALVALDGGTAVSDWARDSVPYIFLAFVPLLAVDAAARIGQRTIVRIFVAAGTLTAISLALTWIERRGFATLPFDRLFFPSIGLTTALFVYALARAQIGGRKTGRWMLLAGVLLTFMLVTGTRTNLVFLLAPVMIALLSGQGIRSAVRLFGVIAGLICLAVVLGLVVGRVTGASSDLIGSRLSSVSESRSGSAAGQSWQMRMEQTQLAWRTFQDHKVVGAGLGHRFPYEDPFGRVTRDYFLDTPVILIAKLGLVGLLVISMLVAAYGLTCRTLRKTADRLTSAALITFLVIWTLTFPLGLPVEEKGFSLGLVFLVALALGSIRRGGTPKPSPPPRGAIESQREPAEAVARAHEVAS